MKSYSFIIDNPPRKSLARSYEPAKQMIPVLISWAQEKRSPQYYSTLSKAIGHGTPRIGDQLGIIANIFDELGRQSNKDIPLLNALVVNKQSKRPSDGLRAVMDGYDEWDERTKIQEAQKANDKAYAFKDWPWVLEDLGLMPYNSSTENSIRKGN